ncbi:MAG TPA: hypothetical protein VF972_12630 [Actinomycetota bacterium]
MTENARRAVDVLRDTGHFQWSVVPILLVVVYIYAGELERRRWSVVFAGLALWGMDWFNEIWNGLVLHFTRHAPMWATPSGSAYVILVGLNIEISLMFAVMGVASVKLLPADRNARVLGLPNRWFFAIALSWAAVGVEELLHAAGALTWDWHYWNAWFPWPIFLIGYLPFFIVAFWVHDMGDRRRQAVTVATVLGVNAILLAVFLSLGWI